MKSCTSATSQGAALALAVMLSLVLVSASVIAEEAGDWIALTGTSSAQAPSLDVLRATFETVELQFDITGMLRETRVTKAGEFTSLSLVNGGVWGEVGHPKLPAVRRLISIPSGAEPRLEVGSTSFETFSFRELGIVSPVMPVQAPVEKVPGALEMAPFDWDADTYARDSFQLAEAVSLGKTGSIRGGRFVELLICPVDVNPVREEVRVLTSARIRVLLPGADMGKTRANRERYSSLPFDALKDRLLIGAGVDPSDPGLPDPPMMLVIYDEALVSRGTNPDFLDYLDWKFQKGLRTVAVTTTETGSTANEIAWYIQDAYDTWDPPPTYVLLVGDVDVIPAWTGGGYGSPDTDLPYSLLDGDDYFPDVYLGRWSVVNNTQLSNIATKTLCYEQVGWTGNDTWEKKAAFMASWDNWQITEGTHNYVISNYLWPDGYTCYKLYRHTYLATKWIVKLRHNQGLSLSTFSGHGSEISWVDGPPFTQSDVRALYNSVYPFVQSYACLTGAFASDQNPECFAETWIRDNHAAIGMMASTVSSYWEEDDILEKRVFEGFCANVHAGEENQTWTAGMMNYGKARYYEYFGDGGTTQMYFEMYNIMGDPSIDLWTAVPAEISVSHPPSLEVAETSFAVTVSGISDWALVCVHDQNEEIYAAEYLLNDGTATMDLGNGASQSGTLHITVTGHDCEPYTGEVPIVNPWECIEDMTLHWEGPDYDEFTVEVHDGAGTSLPVFPPQDRLYFMMDMEGIYGYPHNEKPGIGYFGLIAAYDPATCDTSYTIRIPGSYRHNQGLAYVPDLFGDSFWYTVADENLLYHIDHLGNPIGSYPAEYDIYGLAFDSHNDHLWAIIRGIPDMLVEYDVSSGVPQRIQGPFAVPWSTVGGGSSAAGLEYGEGSDLLLAVNGNSGYLESFLDLDPDYPGPPGPGEPGVAPSGNCALSYTPDAWGIALVERTETAYVAGNPLGGPFPLHVYELGGRTLEAEQEEVSLPAHYALLGNHPNPFNPVTEIRYALPRGCHVRVEIFNVHGQRVALLVDGHQDAGIKCARWDASGTASGLYFCRMTAGDFSGTRKMVLLK